MSTHRQKITSSEDQKLRKYSLCKECRRLITFLIITDGNRTSPANQGYVQSGISRSKSYKEGISFQFTHLQYPSCRLKSIENYFSANGNHRKMTFFTILRRLKVPLSEHENLRKYFLCKECRLLITFSIIIEGNSASSAN